VITTIIGFGISLFVAYEVYLALWVVDFKRGFK
jgi:hypothetical protein